MAEKGAILDQVAKEDHSEEVTFQPKSKESEDGCLGEEHCWQKEQQVQRPWAGTCLACSPSGKEATVKSLSLRETCCKLGLCVDK